MSNAAPSVMVVIPVRYGSSRFPGKPLVMLGRKPMIQHVYEQAAACRVVTEVLVATDDQRIKLAVEEFGGRVAMVATLACVPIFITGRRVSRVEGGAMMVAYLAYLAFVLMTQI